MLIGHQVSFAEWDVVSLTRKQDQTHITAIHETCSRGCKSSKCLGGKKERERSSWLGKKSCLLLPIISSLRFYEWSNWNLLFENASLWCIFILRINMEMHAVCTEAWQISPRVFITPLSFRKILTWLTGKCIYHDTLLLRALVLIGHWTPASRYDVVALKGKEGC